MGFGDLGLGVCWLDWFGLIYGLRWFVGLIYVFGHGVLRLGLADCVELVLLLLFGVYWVCSLVGFVGFVN